MQLLWIIVAVIGAVFIVGGSISVLFGIFHTPKTHEVDTPWSLADKIFEFFKKLAEKLLNPNTKPGTKLIALGLILILIGALTLGGGIYGASKTGDDDPENPPATTTTTTTIAGEGDVTTTTPGG